MVQAEKPVHALPPVSRADEPTLGAIKRALHELSRAPSGSSQQDSGAMLREAHDLLRSLARSQGIDPDVAVRNRLAEVALLRERMVLASIASPDQAAS
ncbi:MAG: hypothetical protein IT482_11805 [Gammaproteobacteria bacterium]|nr:hypothetical protein [Gammaproteobacteria bacterium]